MKRVKFPLFSIMSSGKGMKAPFNVKYQLKMFFKLAKINENKMSKVQVNEMTKSFYAGFGNCLILMKNDIQNLKEDHAVEVFQSLLGECEKFWIDQVKETYSDYEEL